MTAGDRNGDGGGKDVRYEWQKRPPESLQGMPPRRRRLVGWGLGTFLLLPLVSGLVEATGLPQPWRTLLILAGLAALFTGLISAAVRETRQLRTEGIQLPRYAVTRASLIGMSVLTGGLWVLYVIVLVLRLVDGIALPVLPAAATAWLVFMIRRYRADRRAAGPGVGHTGATGPQRGDPP